MSDRSTLTRTREYWALVVDEQELRRLVDECQRVLETDGNDPAMIRISYELSFSDGLSSKTQSLDTVLLEENPRSRSITGLNVYAANHSSQIRLEIEPASTKLSVSGADRQWVYVAISHVEERLRRMKQWHLPSTPMGVAVGITAAVGSLFLFRALAKKYHALLITATAEGKSEATGLGITVILAGIAIAVLIGFLASWLFPSPVFRIGDGVTRHDRLKSVRSKLGWMIVASAVAGPIITLLANVFW